MIKENGKIFLHMMYEYCNSFVIDRYVCARARLRGGATCGAIPALTNTSRLRHLGLMTA